MSQDLTEIKAFVLIFFLVIYFSWHLSPFWSEELNCVDNLFINVSIKVQTGQAQAIKWSIREHASSEDNRFICWSSAQSICWVQQRERRTWVDQLLPRGTLTAKHGKHAGWMQGANSAGRHAKEQFKTKQLCSRQYISRNFFIIWEIFFPNNSNKMSVQL